MKTFFSLILFLSIGLHTLSAQELTIGLNGQLAIPQNEFSESINTLGGGLNVNGHYRFANSPVGLGLDFNFINFGSDSRDEAFSTTIPDLRVRVENQYNLIQLLMQAKVQRQEGIFRPFAEGLAGFNYFFTETSIRDRRDSGADPIASDTNFEDFAFAWGGGAGLKIRVFDLSGQQDNERTFENVSAGYINIGARYLNGSQAEYLKEGSITIENGSVSFDTLQSRTDMIMVQLGFVIRF